MKEKKHERSEFKYLVAFGRDWGRWKRKDEDLCAERLHLSPEHQNTSDKKKKEQDEICEALFSVLMDI